MCTLYCHHKNTQIVVLTMVVSIWLVPVVPTQLKGEWSTAVMDCGGLSVTQEFDTRDGEVICRQLGHKNPRELIKIQFF